MNADEVNKVIDNLCDKFGTTASELIPEMAGYQIVKHAIWLDISLIFIGIAIWLTVKIIRMKRADEKMLVLYPEKLRQIDEALRKTEYWNQDVSSWTKKQWVEVVSEAHNISGLAYYDSDTANWQIFSAIWLGGFGLVVFGIALTKLLGWCLAPTASMFMWVVNALGGN